MSDAGSFYEDESCPDGFDTPESRPMGAAAEVVGVRLGVGLLGRQNELHRARGRGERGANDAWQEWADAGADGPYPDVSVHNHAIDLGRVIEAA